MALWERLHQDILFRSARCDESTLVRLLWDKSSTSVSRSPLNWFRRSSFSWLPWKSRVFSFRSTWKASARRSSSNPFVRCNLSRREGRSPELKASAGSTRNLCPSILSVVMLPSTWSSTSKSEPIFSPHIKCQSFAAVTDWNVLGKPKLGTPEAQTAQYGAPATFCSLPEMCVLRCAAGACPPPAVLVGEAGTTDYRTGALRITHSRI